MSHKFNAKGNKRIPISILDNQSISDLRLLIQKETLGIYTNPDQEIRIITLGRELSGDDRVLRDCGLNDGQILLVSRKHSVVTEEINVAQDDDAFLMSEVVQDVSMDMDRTPVNLPPSLEVPFISRHFAKLFDLLDLPECYAKWIWALLCRIPTDEGLKRRLRDLDSLHKGEESVEWSLVFPTASPLKFAYTIHILRNAYSSLSV